MEVEQSKNYDLIERGLTASDEAIAVLKKADDSRRQTSVELRDMQISLREEFERTRLLMHEFDKQMGHETKEGANWLDRKMERAKAAADQAISSVLMVKDVQTLEKKVDVLWESVHQLGKAFTDYEKQVDMKDLMDQVTEMVYRTEKKEQEVFGGKMPDEETIERAFRGAMECLYGLQTTDPKLQMEAKQLADTLRIFRDAAANKNFQSMVSKSGSTYQSPASASGSSEFALSSATFSGDSSLFNPTNSSIESSSITSTAPVVQ